MSETLTPSTQNTREGQKEQQACANTDRELWREREGDYYADSIHVTEHGGIGINCGGRVYVKTLRAWHALARSVPSAPDSSGARGISLTKEDVDHIIEIAKRDTEIIQLLSVCKQMREALEQAKGTIEIWHGGAAWPEYQHSPEMKQINAALALLPEDGNER